MKRIINKIFWTTGLAFWVLYAIFGIKQLTIYTVHSITDYDTHKKILDVLYENWGTCPIKYDDWIRECNGKVWELSDDYCPKNHGVGKINCNF